jgi:hypothetical protein
MATIIDIWEVGDRETSEESSSRGPVRNQMQYFDCEVAKGDESIDHNEILADSRVPARGEVCPWDSTSVCRKRNVKQDSEQPFLFHITINYSNQPLADEEPDRTDEENPLLIPADVSWDSEEVREALTKDLDDKRIVNSAGQRFETAVEAVRRRRVITIVKNFGTWDDSVAEAHEECVNLVTFLGKPPGTVFCKRITARRVYQSSIYFYPVTFIFVHDKLGWKARVTDVGTAKAIAFDVNGNATEWEAFTDSSGTPLTSAVLLNGAGAKLTAGVPYVHEFRVHNAIDHNGLDLL